MAQSRARLPLATQVILGLLLNLTVVGAAFLGAFVLQVRWNPGWLLSGRTGERLRSVAEMMATDLAQARTEGRIGAEGGVLERYREVYDLDFLLFEVRGRSVVPTTNPIPPEVFREITRPRPDPPANQRPPGMRRAEFPGGGASPAEVENHPGSPGPEVEERGLRSQGGGGARNRAWARGPLRVVSAPPSVVRAGEPPAYWIILPLPLRGPGPGMVLVVRSASLWSSGLLLDPRPWLIAGSGALILSILFWLPIVRGITRDVARMTRQTEEIAAGRFDTRLELRRPDELGRLAEAIDVMASRLAHHVAGQKRFLGDAAHELSTPIARMQTAVAILEARPGQDNTAYLEDLREELDEMSALIQELLTFSRALHGRPARLQTVALRSVVDRAWTRESHGTESFANEVDAALNVLADPALLQRAIANVLRNALRYAASAGPIRATARVEGSQVSFAIEDVGPGVPAEALPRLFEPFFRPEDSRSREFGGTGLGLAIVRTCIDACGGTVSAANGQPKGFVVTVRLTLAPHPPTMPAPG